MKIYFKLYFCQKAHLQFILGHGLKVSLEVLPPPTQKNPTDTLAIKDQKSEMALSFRLISLLRKWTLAF